MRVFEFGSRTANVSLERIELDLVIAGLLELAADDGDAHEFLDRTGTSPAHLSTLTGAVQSLRRRMDRLKESEEEASR